VEVVMGNAKLGKAAGRAAARVQAGKSSGIGLRYSWMG
jgi:hypothetical protein